MKVLIVSDSHGLTRELEKIIDKHSGEVDYMIHCGDSELKHDHPLLADFIKVGGNSDLDERFPEEIVKKIGDVTIFITHGHLYSVKSNLMKLAYRARELSANMVCFGHSHFLGAEMVYDTLFLNPGSIRLPRGRKEKTYVIVDIGESEYRLHVYDMDQGEISELLQTFSLSN